MPLKVFRKNGRSQDSGGTRRRHGKLLETRSAECLEFYGALIAPGSRFPITLPSNGRAILPTITALKIYSRLSRGGKGMSVTRAARRPRPRPRVRIRCEFALICGAY